MASKSKSSNSNSNSCSSGSSNCNNNNKNINDVEQEIEQLFFKGKSFCLDFPTSLSPTKKSQYTQFIKKNGGKIDFSITSKTNYYITHLSNIESQSSRTKNALKLNIDILLDTFIYNCFDNKLNSLDYFNYLYVNGLPANLTINENIIENSISETYFVLNNILSTFKQQTTTTTSSSLNTININTINNNCNYGFDDKEIYEEEYESSELSYGLDMFEESSSLSSSSSSSSIFSPVSLISTTQPSPSSLLTFTSTLNSNLTSNLYESITNDLNKPSKPLSKFELLLLQKKENNEKKKLEIQKIEEEKKRIKDEQIEIKRKERQDKLDQSQKEKQIKIESEKERRKLVLEKTKSTLTHDQLIKLTKSNITITNNTNNNKNTNNKNNKLKSTSFALQIDHEGIRIKKEQLKLERLKKIEIEKEEKKREKDERTRLFHDNKNELERIENEEKIRKQKESLESFLKRQEKRLAKEKKEQKDREDGIVDSTTTTSTTTIVKEPEVDEDLRKLFVGGINCDDITDSKIVKDLKKLEKIRDKRIQSLLKLFDKFGKVQKRTINSSKGLFFITYFDTESCTKAIQFYSIKENRKAAIEEISKLPKKSPLYNPNKKFYVKIVKSNEKAKKKQIFDKQKIENLKATAKNELQKEQDAEFDDWEIAK
ncbi:hypothetical protein ACTFIW_007550 [Dictyostelium discoideum]